jgi:hypothetical protein
VALLALVMVLELPQVAHAVVLGERAPVDAAGILTGIAAICSALVWPVLIGLVLFGFREPAKELLHAAVGVAEGANRFKIWQIEFDRDVQQQVAQSEAAALGAPVLGSAAAGAAAGAALAAVAGVVAGQGVAGQRVAGQAAAGQAAAGQAAAGQAGVEQRTAVEIATGAVASGEVAAASRVRALLDAAPTETLRKAEEAAIKARVLGFAQEYEAVRAGMPAGDDRTRVMNGVVAKMRTLALAADLFLDELMNAPASPGRRLAAICILQMKPEMRTVSWLVERMRIEQPFVFFHASVALLNAVRRFGAAEKPTLQPALHAALAQVQSFGENADINTVRSLTLALSELETSA